MSPSDLYIALKCHTCSCTDLNCSDIEHRRDIDALYNDICSGLRKSSVDVILKCHSNNAKDYVIPGWNDYVKLAHQEARSSYILWRNMGKPRQGPACDIMRRTRMNFKYSLKQCQGMEDAARANAMAKSFRKKDTRSFWKSMKNHYNKSIPLATTVNGATNPLAISNLWKEHFEKLLNSVRSENDKPQVNSLIESITDNHIAITPKSVLDSIDKLKAGKSCGNDGLSAEHFMQSDIRIAILLSLFYTSALKHGYLPSDFMKTVIVPLVKNKTGDTSDVHNYRPIALVTVASKIFENVLLDLLQTYLLTCDNQFGFKKGHATEHCIFVLKNAIDYYRSHNSPVFTCMLDASKCFDKINHWTLFKKLISRGIPLIYVRILVYWYRNQTFCVKWGSITSSFFDVTNGVRQGGILSPYLFAVYVNDLSVILNSSNIGLHMCNNPLNHIFYADDLCIMASSPGGLQSILNICSQYASVNDITFNFSKSMCVVFKPDGYKLNCPDIFLNDTKLNYVDNAKYLGVILNHRCKDDNDIQRHLRGLYARTNTLIRKFHKCTTDVKLTLFQAYCLPSYCSHLWARFNKYSYSKLNVAFNNVYRRILGYKKYESASHMFVTSHVDNFDAFMRKNVYGFIQRLRAIENNLVKCVLSCAYNIPNGIWQRWLTLLYTHSP